MDFLLISKTVEYIQNCYFGRRSILDDTYDTRNSTLNSCHKLTILKTLILVLHPICCFKKVSFDVSTRHGTNSIRKKKIFYSDADKSATLAFV